MGSGRRRPAAPLRRPGLLAGGPGRAHVRDDRRPGDAQLFPKDVAALKQLAGNSGYHFQLLASVIEVNELQKRRVVGKLQRHSDRCGASAWPCSGWRSSRTPTTCARRASLVLAGRLVAEGVSVIAYDPIAAEKARPLLDPRVDLARTMREALVDADAAVIVTEWEEFRGILEPTARDLMPTVPDRRPEPGRPGRRGGRGLRVRVGRPPRGRPTSPRCARDRGRARRRRGHAPAAAHARPPEADAAHRAGGRSSCTSSTGSAPPASSA